MAGYFNQKIKTDESTHHIHEQSTNNPCYELKQHGRDNQAYQIILLPRKTKTKIKQTQQTDSANLLEKFKSPTKNQ